MRKLVIVMLIALVAVCGSVQQANAQSATAVPNVELSAGYQFQRFGGGGGGDNWGKGWFADIAKTVSRTVSVVGQVTGSYKSETVTSGSTSASVSASAHSFMGGARFSAWQAMCTVFFQALAGAVRIGAGVKVSGTSSATVSDSDTAKAVLAGVGFTALMNRNVSFRAGGDYIRVFPDGDSGYILRATAGLVFAFGAR